MEQEDNADPEVGPEPGTSSNTAQTDDEPTQKRPEEEKGEEIIPLTHKHTFQTSEEEDHPSHSQKPPDPKLIHPLLLKVPMQVRYTVYGGLSSALFMILYNSAVTRVGHLYVPSTIYAATYLIFIPMQHAMAACMVFGWPDRYLPSLTSNVPIGLTAIALGSYLTAYLDRINFDQSVEDMLSSMGFLHPSTADNTHAENNEFYTSFLVLVVTSLWSFILSVLVNTPSETPDKKEL